MTNLNDCLREDEPASYLDRLWDQYQEPEQAQDLPSDMAFNRLYLDAPNATGKQSLKQFATMQVHAANVSTPNRKVVFCFLPRATCS